jgi:type IV secretion system protein TrbE
LRRLGSRWCLHIEAVRAPSQTYPASQFPDPVSDLVDEERREGFEAQERHFESRYFLTFTYLPPEEAISTAESLLLENAPSGRGAEGMYRAALSDFRSTVHQIADILTAIMPEVAELSDDETLTYLHSCISTKRHPISTPSSPTMISRAACCPAWAASTCAPSRSGPIRPPRAPACSIGSMSWASAIAGSAGICRWTRKTPARP